MLESERISGKPARQSVISVCGSGTVAKADAAYELARSLGAALSKNSYAVSHRRLRQLDGGCLAMSSRELWARHRRYHKRHFE